MNLSVGSGPLADVAPPGPSDCSAFGVLLVAAAVIVVARLIRRRREERRAQARPVRPSDGVV
jgi:hypothetical protein